MSDHLSTQQLINRIESADRKYRRSTTVLLIVIGVAIALSIFLQYQALEQFKNQSAERSADSKVLQESIKRETEKTNQVLRCIAAYFANPNRADTVIQNIDQCNIDPSTGAVIFDTEQNTPAGSGPLSLSPGPSGGPSTSNPPENPDTSKRQNDDPPRGIIPRTLDSIFDLVNDARGIIGL